jgi:hypothetical protein
MWSNIPATIWGGGGVAKARLYAVYEQYIRKRGWGLCDAVLLYQI